MTTEAELLNVIISAQEDMNNHIESLYGFCDRLEKSFAELLEDRPMPDKQVIEERLRALEYQVLDLRKGLSLYERR